MSKSQISNFKSKITVAGIVLAGGMSSRMGQPKATLPFGPELMLQRVVRLLGAVVDPIVVVAAPGQPLPPLPGEVMVAHDEREGAGAAGRAAARAVGGWAACRWGLRDKLGGAVAGTGLGKLKDCGTGGGGHWGAHGGSIPAPTGGGYGYGINMGHG